MSTLPSVKHFPVYFNVFDTYLEKVENLEASVLLSRLQYHCSNSKIIRKGQVWFTRQKEEMANWFRISTSKLDTLLNLLEKKGLISCQNFKYQNIRQLHISVQNCQSGYVNFASLEDTIAICGGLKEAMIFLRILYHYQHSSIEIDGLKWFTKSREDIASWAKISVRTVDTILKSLKRKGLFIKRTYKWKGVPQSHFHIPESVALSLVPEKAISTYSQDICKIDPAKIKVPYIENINQSKQTKINNTTNHLEKKSSDINFSNQVAQASLNQRQIKYLEGSLKNLMGRDKLKISNPQELLEQLKFSVFSWVNTKKLPFTHAVNRACAVVKSGNWRTPIGFNKHSDIGKKYHEAVINREKFSEEKKDRALNYQNQQLSNLVLSIESLQKRLIIEESDLKKVLIQGQISRLKSDFSDLSRSTQQNFLVAS